jgi:hypothetical protein
LRVSTLEKRPDLLGNRLDCGNKLSVGKRILGDKFVCRDCVVFIILIDVDAAERHGGDGARLLQFKKFESRRRGRRVT